MDFQWEGVRIFKICTTLLLSRLTPGLPSVTLPKSHVTKFTSLRRGVAADGRVAVPVLALSAAEADAEPVGVPAVEALEMRRLAAGGAALDLDDGEARGVGIIARMVVDDDLFVVRPYFVDGIPPPVGDDHVRGVLGGDQGEAVLAQFEARDQPAFAELGKHRVQFKHAGGGEHVLGWLVVIFHVLGNSLGKVCIHGFGVVSCGRADVHGVPLVEYGFVFNCDDALVLGELVDEDAGFLDSASGIDPLCVEQGWHVLEEFLLVALEEGLGRDAEFEHSVAELLHHLVLMGVEPMARLLERLNFSLLFTEQVRNSHLRGSVSSPELQEPGRGEFCHRVPPLPECRVQLAGSSDPGAPAGGENNAKSIGKPLEQVDRRAVRFVGHEVVRHEIGVVVQHQHQQHVLGRQVVLGKAGGEALEGSAAEVHRRLRLGEGEELVQTVGSLG